MKFKIDNKFTHLRNQKQFCFSLSANLYKINYTYSTLRGNKNSNTKYLLFFEDRVSSFDVKPSKNNPETCFYNHINDFNEHFHFRRLVDVQISSMELISKLDPHDLFECNNGYVYININHTHLNKNNFIINKLSIHETMCELEINNKQRHSICYVLSTNSSQNTALVSNIISRHSIYSLLYKKNKSNSKTIPLNLTKVLNAEILNTFKAKNIISE